MSEFRSRGQCSEHAWFLKLNLTLEFSVGLDALVRQTNLSSTITNASPKSSVQTPAPTTTWPMIGIYISLPVRERYLYFINYYPVREKFLGRCHRFKTNERKTVLSSFFLVKICDPYSKYLSLYVWEIDAMLLLNHPDVKSCHVIYI